jgi:hypothetical protein
LAEIKLTTGFSSNLFRGFPLVLIDQALMGQALILIAPSKKWKTHFDWNMRCDFLFQTLL